MSARCGDTTRTLPHDVNFNVPASPSNAFRRQVPPSSPTVKSHRQVPPSSPTPSPTRWRLIRFNSRRQLFIKLDVKVSERKQRHFSQFHFYFVCFRQLSELYGGEILSNFRLMTCLEKLNFSGSLGGLKFKKNSIRRIIPVLTSQVPPGGLCVENNWIIQ